MTSEHFAQRVVRRRQGWLRRTVSTEDIAGLDDRETIARWIRGMHEGKSQTVAVHRPWGSLLVNTMGHPPAGVTVYGGARLRFAGSPAGMTLPDVAPLAPAQVEQIVLDALTADRLPEGPVWHEV